jgi:methyl-accepting chemotaxis protein
MDEGVQQNAALVEEAAAASENMASAAEELKMQVGQFKIAGDEPRPAALPEPQPRSSAPRPAPAAPADQPSPAKQAPAGDDFFAEGEMDGFEEF